ncbi:hypothetical protein [Undibacterium sp. Tian12W]|uniref:hypothetical protein n=1 Tax=Undibacterium sp. Tian12W TaxID=3413054 RepID=UPI003BF156EE
MLYAKAYIEQFLVRFVRPKRPDLEAPLLDAVDALNLRTPLSDAILAAMVEAVSEKQTTVYEASTQIFGKIAEYDDRALQMIRDMAISKHAHVRHNALLCLTQKTQSTACIEIIRDGLRDKSSRVRRKAADWAIRLPLQSRTRYS